jgi:pilus assembly protein Flp/PilA
MNTEVSKRKEERMLLLQTRVHGAYLALRARLDREEGQALVEYALILALIAVVSIAILQAMGVNVSRIFNKVNTALSDVTP